MLHIAEKFWNVFIPNTQRETSGPDADWKWVEHLLPPQKKLQSQNKHSRGFWLSTKYLDTDQINAKRLKKKSVNVYTPTM